LSLTGRQTNISGCLMWMRSFRKGFVWSVDTERGGWVSDFFKGTVRHFRNYVHLLSCCKFKEKIDTTLSQLNMKRRPRHENCQTIPLTCNAPTHT